MTSTTSSKSAKRIRQQAVDWVLLLEDGDLSSSDRDSLQAWLDRDTRHAAAFERARQLYGEASEALIANPAKTKRILRGKSRKGVAVLTIVALLLCGAPFAADGLLYLRADIVSSSAEMPVIDLPDGSRAYLNASSALAEEIDEGRREVTLLEGEAYFEVRSDPDHPFVVRAGRGRIEVLGTAFNVNRIADRTEITVTKHTVRVTGASPDQVVLLRPGMRVSYGGDGVLGPVETVPEGLETPWRAGRLIFEDRPLPLVVGEIARHLPGKVVLAAPSARERRVSGSFDLTDPSQALESFATAFDLKLVRAGSLLTLLY